MAAPSTQADFAVRMYAPRAPTYEDSWHPDYSQRFVALMPLRPGDHVLSLCCGTGLDAFLAAAAVGNAGRVVGVDISAEMLEVATSKQRADAELGPRLTLLRHDVTDLGSLGEAGAAAGVRKGAFDAIMCSNAFVLFDDPAGVVRAWREFLRPGGVLAVDITHEHNLRSGLVMERVAERMGVQYPSNRAWVKSADSFRVILEAEGYVVESVVELEKVSGQRSTYYTLEQADDQFDYISRMTISEPIANSELKDRAREVFREEWAKDAVDGKVEAVDTLYLYIARKGE